MKINLIVVGKLQKHLTSIFKNYIKKISFFANLKVIELKEQNHNNIETQKLKETKAILDAIPKNSKVFLCSKEGKSFSSYSFSQEFNQDNLTFVIGGSHGVVESFFKEKISFSKMTFPHQLFRIFLIEQIYRALSIKNNLKYHK